MRICSGQGCLRAVPDDARFCYECKPEAKAVDDIREHTLGYDATLDRLRKSPRWQRLRKRVVQEQPLCKRCDLHFTEIVDHIVPALVVIVQAQLSGLYKLDRFAGYFFRSNLQGLCRLCHAAKTDEDKAHLGEWPDAVAKEQAAPKRRYTF